MIRPLIMLLTVLAASLWFAAPAYCWNCPPKRCQFDVNCGVGCFCYKGSMEIEGVCVSE